MKSSKMKKSTLLTFTIITIFSLIASCHKDNQITEPELSIVGEWKHEYELLSDGTKEFDNPYALLEFDYSDGFILKENHTGNSVWYNTINGDFKWTSENSKLIISVTRLDNSIDEFEYLISNLTENSLEIETPKGHKYFMLKH